MGQYEAGVYIVLVIFLSIIVFTALIIRFKSQEKRAGDARQQCGVGTGGRCAA